MGNLLAPSNHPAGPGISPQFHADIPYQVNMRGKIRMASKWTDIAIEKIVAACDGNMHGALEALLLVNEHLEAELHLLYATVSSAPRKSPRFKRVH